MQQFVEYRGMAQRKLFPANNLLALRKSSGMTQEDVARLAGTSNQQIGMLERREREMAASWMNRLAPIFSVEPADLIAEPRLVPIVGTVGAGAEVFPIDDYPLVQPERLAEHVYPADGMEYAEAPPTGPLRDMVALRITGDSMHPIKEGWLVYCAIS